MTVGWIVARAKSGREAWAVENIAQQGSIPYLPRYLERRGTLARARPLFGPYIFVQTAGPWRFLLGTFGVIGVVLFGEAPAVVRDSIIAAIKAKEVDGLVVLPQAPATPASRWKPGEAIRVRGGIFSGYVGIYEGIEQKQRERVLLDFLGRKTPVLLASDMLEAA